MVSSQARSQSNDALWKEGRSTAGCRGILFVCCLPLFFLKGQLVLLPLIRKVYAKVQLFPRHNQLRVWWGTKVHSWLLGAPVAPHLQPLAPCLPPPLLEGPGPGQPQATRILTPRDREGSGSWARACVPPPRVHFCGKVGSILVGFISLRRVHEYLVKRRDYCIVSTSYICNS